MLNSTFSSIKLGSACSLITDGAHFSPIPQDEGPPIVNAKDIPDGRINLSSCTRISQRDWALLKSQNCSPQVGDVLLSKDGTIGRVVHYREELGVVLLSSIAILRPDESLDSDFLAHSLRSHYFDSQLFRLQSGSALKRLILSDIRKIEVPKPSFKVQQRIAEILSTVDEAIEQIEALIAKTRQIKAGLMHDLFTRGVTPDGQLRPPRDEAPHLYQESPLGWIPKGWGTPLIADVADSLIDGPFGSNLKSEHYVESGGVRVVRLQNIQEGEYDDSQRAFVSESYANWLNRHQVVTGDILIAALGEDNYPVGRACCYPQGISSAINKADCFRLRCKSSIAINPFIMSYLNTPAVRSQMRRYEQGVTRRRVNLGNIRKIYVAVPLVSEQKNIVARIEATNDRIACQREELSKRMATKCGLMNDLLTGHVRVLVPAERTKAGR